MKKIYIDVETGGTNPERSALLQLAGIIEIDGRDKEAFNYMIRPLPGDLVEDGALKVNNLTREDIETFDTAGTVLEAFKRLMSEFVSPFDKKDKFHFIGYNSHSFDMPFVRKFFSKQGDKYFGSWFFYPSIDVMILAAERLIAERAEMPNFRLHTVCKKMRIEVEDEKLHEALYDVELTRELYRRV